MSSDTIRARMEAIRDRHPLGRDVPECQCWNCLDSHDAIAALILLDEAPMVHPALSRHGGERVLPDPGSVTT